MQTWTGTTWVPSTAEATNTPAAAVAQRINVADGAPQYATGRDDGTLLPWHPAGATAAPLTLPATTRVQRLTYSTPPGGPEASGFSGSLGFSRPSGVSSPSGFSGPPGVSGLPIAVGPTVTATRADTFGSTSLVAQRAPDVPEPGAAADEPAAGPQPGGVPAQETAPAGGGRTAGGAGGAGGAAGKVPDPEELLKKLYDPLLRRLKTELRLDRERHGLRGGPG